MRFVPKDYQLEGAEHLVSGPHRALLAGMGLGKTAMSLCAMDHLIRHGESRGALVVAPMRVCNLTWPNEVRLWDDFRWMQVANLRTPEGQEAWQKGSAHLYTLNYEALPKFVAEHLERRRGRSLPVDTVIWDELSRAKNPASSRINAFRDHRGKFHRHWGLTGTPSPNSKLDLFAQYRLLDGGERLGNDFYRFRKKYFYPMDKDQRYWQVMFGHKETLEKMVADMTLVLRSEDYLKIPDTEVIDVDVAMPPTAWAQYRKITKELLLLIQNHEVNAINAAGLVNKLLQITSGAVYDVDRAVVHLHDAKVRALAAIYKQQQGEPLLVTYQYQHEEERLRRAFPDAVCFGDYTTPKRQQELIRAWNAKEVPMLILSPQSGGHGLNMQYGGSDVVWFSLTFSREYYDQLNARVARMGQECITRVFRLLVPGSMDDAVAEALRRKGRDQSALMDAILNFKLLQ